MPNSQKQKFNLSNWLLGLGVLGAIALIGLAFAASPKEQPPNTITVAKGNLRIAVEEEGDVKAVNPYAIVNDYRYSTKVIFVLPEGTQVKKGDLIMELDDSEIDDRYDKYKVTVEDAKFKLEQARERMEIERSEIEAGLRAAKLVLEFAALDLNQYEEGTWPLALKDYDRTITETREKLLLAKEELKFSQQFLESGFETRSSVEKKSMTVTQLVNQLERMETKREMAVKYDYPVKVKKFRRALEEATADLERIGFETTRNLAIEKSNVRSREQRYKYYSQILRWYEEQMQATKIYATRDGMLVFPQSRYSSSRGMIEEGTRVYWQQELALIPDFSELKVKFSVHETMIHHLSVGQKANITLDSYPGETFEGVLSKVSLVPDTSRSYYQPNLRVYKTEVTINDTIPDAMPGMNAEIDIAIADLKDVLIVPIEAITTSAGQKVVYAYKDGEIVETPVEVGLHNDEKIQILSGVQEGDIILEKAPFEELEQTPSLYELEQMDVPLDSPELTLFDEEDPESDTL